MANLHRPSARDSVTRSRAWLTTLALGLCAALACTPSFESAEVVSDLRVIGITAEPPEALIDVDAGTVEDVQVTVLVADPVHRAQKVTVVPTLCLPSDGARCVKTAVELGPTTQPQDQISFSLQAQILARQLPPAQLVALLQAAVADDKLKGLGGVRLQLMVGVDDQLDPNGQQTALKTLLFSPKLPGGNPNKNHNPAALGLTLINLNTKQTISSPASGEPITIYVGRQIGVRPRLGDGSSETYRTIDLSGRVVTLTENLSWNFYTTQDGDLDRGTADEPIVGAGDPPDGLVRFQGVKDGAHGTFWAVVRDGRGGQAWTIHPWSAVRGP